MDVAFCSEKSPDALIRRAETVLAASCSGDSALVSVSDMNCVAA